MQFTHFCLGIFTTFKLNLTTNKSLLWWTYRNHHYSCCEINDPVFGVLFSVYLSHEYRHFVSIHPVNSRIINIFRVVSQFYFWTCSMFVVCFDKAINAKEAHEHVLEMAIFLFQCDVLFSSSSDWADATAASAAVVRLFLFYFTKFFSLFGFFFILVFFCCFLQLSVCERHQQKGAQQQKQMQLPRTTTVYTNVCQGRDEAHTVCSYSL